MILLYIKLNKIYNTKVRKKLRAQIEIFDHFGNYVSTFAVKCTAKHNTLISGAGYSFEIVGIDSDAGEIEMIVHRPQRRFTLALKETVIIR